MAGSTTTFLAILDPSSDDKSSSSKMYSTTYSYRPFTLLASSSSILETSIQPLQDDRPSRLFDNLEISFLGKGCSPLIFQSTLKSKNYLILERKKKKIMALL